MKNKIDYTFACPDCISFNQTLLIERGGGSVQLELENKLLSEAGNTVMRTFFILRNFALQKRQRICVLYSNMYKCIR